MQNGVRAINALTVQVSSIAIGRAPASTYAALPAAASSQGVIRLVTDLTSTTHGATAAGGGTLKFLVFSDGTNWIVL